MADEPNNESIWNNVGILNSPVLTETSYILNDFGQCFFPISVFPFERCGSIQSLHFVIQY